MKRDLFLTLTIFLFSFLILLWFSTRVADFVNMDAMLFGEEARNIVRGEPYSEIRWIDRPFEYIQMGGIPRTTTWPVPPMYPFVVASFFRIFGMSFNTMKIVGIVFGSLTVLCTFYLAKTQSNEKWGLLAVFLLGMHPYFIYNSIIPGNEIFAAFFSTAAILLSFLRKKRGVLLQGVFSALAFMSRYEVGAIALLSILANHSFYSSKDCNYSLMMDVREKALLLLSFTSTLLPLLYYNSVLYESSIVLPSLSAEIFLGNELTTNMFVSPLVFVGIMFLLLSSTVLLSLLSRRVRVPLKLTETKHSIYLIASLLVALLIGSIPYLLGLGEYSPIFFIFGLTGICTSLSKIRKYLCLLSFTFLSVAFFCFVSFRVDPSYMAPRYAVPLMPILAVFGSLAISRLYYQLRATSINFPLGLSTVKLLSVLLLAALLASSSVGYGVLASSPAIIKGPFAVKNWNDAKSWISNNTQVTDTVIAMWPIPLFYCDRRTVTFLPDNKYDNSQLYAIINQSQASYLVIDYDMRYGVNNTLIANLYDNPKNYEGFNLVYQTGSLEWKNPRLVIYELSLTWGNA